MLSEAVWTERVEELQKYVRGLNALHGITFNVDLLKRIDALSESRNVHEHAYLTQRCVYMQLLHHAAESGTGWEPLD